MYSPTWLDGGWGTRLQACRGTCAVLHGRWGVLGAHGCRCVGDWQMWEDAQFCMVRLKLKNI